MNKEKFNELWTSHPHIVQDPQELNWLVDTAEGINPQGIIEVGVAEGGSFQFWLEILNEGGIAIGIDPNLPTVLRHEFLKRKAEAKHIELHFITGRSEDPTVVQQVATILGSRKVDFIFIDAIHTDEAVKQDYDNYSPFVRVGGLIGFHDITSYKKFWMNLAGRKEWLEETFSTGIWWKDG